MDVVIDSRNGNMLILGCGYVGKRLGEACVHAGMQVFGTTRSRQGAGALRQAGIEPVVTSFPADIPKDILQGCDTVLDSIPLERSEGSICAGQPGWLPALVRCMPHIRWAGYLSATSVYGDANGAWVDEAWPCKPTSKRGIERLKAENAWLQSGAPVEIFRLAGIYGPERNIIARLKAGEYRAVQWNPPHYSSRIHVDDIVAAIMAAIHTPKPGRVVNLADDEPLAHAHYVAELARAIGAPAPVILTPEEGKRQLSPSMIDFFRDNKRVSNSLLHLELLPELQYPNFRVGLAIVAPRAASSTYF